jgi:hypothetical protein
VLPIPSPENELQTVYNFEVKSLHSYFVGNGLAWVHNTSILVDKKITDTNGHVSNYSRLPSKGGSSVKLTEFSPPRTSLVFESTELDPDKLFRRISSKAYEPLTGEVIGRIDGRYYGNSKELYIQMIEVEDSSFRGDRGIQVADMNARKKFIEQHGTIATHLQAMVLSEAKRLGPVDSIKGVPSLSNEDAILAGKIPPAAYHRVDVGYGWVMFSDGYIVGEKFDGFLWANTDEIDINEEILDGLGSPKGALDDILPETILFCILPK